MPANQLNPGVPHDIAKQAVAPNSKNAKIAKCAPSKFSCSALAKCSLQWSRWK